MAAPSKPKIIYFNIRGRAEPIKLALAAAGVEFEFEPAVYDDMKADLEHYKFGQVPRYIDDEVDLCQSNAILRHVGRKHGLYGKSRAEAAAVDETIDGVNELANKLFSEVVYKKDDPDAAAAFWAAHIDPASEAGRAARGAHASYLSRILSKSGSGFFLPSGLSIADILMVVVTEQLSSVYTEEKLAQQWPNVVAHYHRVLSFEGITAYLKSPQRLPANLGGGSAPTVKKQET